MAKRFKSIHKTGWQEPFKVRKAQYSPLLSSYDKSVLRGNTKWSKCTIRHTATIDVKRVEHAGRERLISAEDSMETS